MKTPILSALCLSLLAVCGCQRQSAKAPPAGSFGVEVEDIVKDEYFRVILFRIVSTQPGWVTSQKTAPPVQGGCSAEMLKPPGQKYWGTRLFVLASKAANNANSNALIQINLKLESTGGDGGMLINGSFGASGGGTYTVPANTSLNQFLDSSIPSGVYPMEKPVEIGSIDGRPVLLLVGKQRPILNPNSLAFEMNGASVK